MRLLSLAIIGVILFLFYAALILFLQTYPASDFEIYYNIALQLKAGGTLYDSYKYFQGPLYPYLLSFLFRLTQTHSVLLPQFLNGLMMTALCLLMMKYSFVRPGVIFGIGFLFITLNLNSLGMITLLCSEIPYGFFFMSGLFCLWLGYRFTEETGFEGKKSLVLLFSSGIFLGISQSIRPTTTPFLLLWSGLLMMGLIVAGGWLKESFLKHAWLLFQRLILPCRVTFEVLFLFAVFLPGLFGLARCFLFLRAFLFGKRLLFHRLLLAF